jgi:serine/threonine-protein kinase
MQCPACQTPNLDEARFCAKCGSLLPAPAGPDPLVGSIVGGRFRVTGILGEGGMGRVYTAEQQMGTKIRKVAVKTLLSEYAKDTKVVERFMRECATVVDLEHPNTIKFFDYGKTDAGDLYIAMELLSGVSLEKALQNGALPPERVDKIIGQVAGSLAEAHEKGIVHRDLKPDNIYLTTRAGQEDVVKVLDFGIAKHDDQHNKAEEKLTQQGTVLGTPPYMSPEQFRGGALDARSDIYSLGVVTYEMLTGRLPFEADTPWLWATQHMTAQPFPFETLPIGSQVPSKMRTAVMRALSKDVAHRQQTVKEFYEELTLGTPGPSVLDAPRSSLPDGVGPAGTTQIPTSPSQPPIHVTGGIPITGGYPQRDSGGMVPAPPIQEKKSKAGLVIGIVLALLAVVGGGGAAVYFLVIVPGQAADAEKECKSALNSANGGHVVQAVNHFKSCDGGTKSAAKTAIDTAAQKSAEKPGCTGLEDARAADRIGLPSALNLLKGKKCH